MDLERPGEGPEFASEDGAVSIATCQKNAEDGSQLGYSQPFVFVPFSREQIRELESRRRGDGGNLIPRLQNGDFPTALWENLEDLGFTKCTMVQFYGLECVTSGSDALLCSGPGTGKTLCFILLVFQALERHFAQPQMSYKPYGRSEEVHTGACDVVHLVFLRALLGAKPLKRSGFKPDSHIFST